jgi:predicted CoA-substrate-specific enzyme activase
MATAAQSECLLGLDLGAAELKVALYPPAGAPVQKDRIAARGHPLESLLKLPFDYPRDAPIRVAVTGVGQTLLSDLPACLCVNEVVATAAAVRGTFADARTVIDLGGQFSKWILLGDDADPNAAVADFASNGLCAAGAGAFLEQQAGRLGLSLHRLGVMAAAAPRGATIAGRCSVFAKSDMIHLQQKGTPLEEVAYGLCQALVRTFVSTVMQGRSAAAPVVLVGGGAANPGLVRAFREQLRLWDNQLLAPEDAAFFGACGAAHLAVNAPLTSLAEFLSALEQQVNAPSPAAGTGTAALQPLGSLQPDEHPVEDPTPAVGPVGGPVEAYLGVDVGSVSTNLVLLSPDFRVLQGIYLSTRGRPVEVLNEGLGLIRDRFGERLHILGVGSTGSGRHLAAKVIGADAIHNEITAQMVSSILFAPEVDTIFEIGGQDSKYISIRDGTLADFEMNKICAGGTGSFLEEQAERLGIRIVGEFAGWALRSERPCDLGTRCTVFMDTELVRAQERGAPLEDLCAGLAYSVARNYLEKVVAGRPVGRSIMFQGGTASNRAVVAAFRQLLGRAVYVHPYNRISGAIGAALLAERAMPQRSRFLGFESCAESSLRSFECQRCENRCQVNRVQVGPRVVHFGDVCDRYSERDRDPKEICRPFPELFAERERLMESFLPAAESGRPRIGLLRATLNLEFLPFWTAFFRELGYDPVVSSRPTPALLQDFSGGLPAEVCLPIKCAAAHAKALLAAGSVEKIFVPGVLECPPRSDADPSHTCFFVQELAGMLRVELKDRVITAQFAFTNGIIGLIEPVLSLADALGLSLDSVRRAFLKAQAVQARFVDARKQLGKHALETSFERAAVVLGRPYNTHDPFLNLSLARYLEQAGLPALPWDLLPFDEVRLAERWQTVPWHYNREQLRVFELIRRDPRLFPVIVSSYGCGPDGFSVKHLEEMLSDRPRLLLEFDEHRGEAGLITRLEAFSDEITEHLKRRGRRVPTPAPTPGPNPLPAGHHFFIPNFSEHAQIYAAVLRSAGFSATVLPIPDEETVKLGERYASGRECHPYVILAGELVRFAQHPPSDGEAVFLVPNTTAPCLLRQYGDGFRILLQRQGLNQVEVWEATTEQIGRLVGIRGLCRLYEGLLATDILFILGARLRPYEKQKGAVDRCVAGSLEQVAHTVAERGDVGTVLAQSSAELWSIPRTADPGSRPVVGVTGDLYTRINPVGNASLFRRLEQMGCEAWPSPFFATATDLGAALEAQKLVEHGHFSAAVLQGLSRAVTLGLRLRLMRHVSPEVTARAVEPPVEDLIRLGRPYVGPKTNYLILLTAAKVVDFLSRGASGVINAAGINCVVGTAAASVIPAIRADFRGAPILTLIYGSSEGPAQRIRLETFVHQVHRWSRKGT